MTKRETDRAERTLRIYGNVDRVDRCGYDGPGGWRLTVHFGDGSGQRRYCTMQEVRDWAEDRG